MQQMWDEEMKAYNVCRSAMERYHQLHLKWSVAADKAGLLHSTAQWGTVVLATLTPVMVVLNQAPRLVQVLPSAAAAAITAINGIQDWRRLSLARRRICESLDGEFEQFVGGLGPYGDSVDIGKRCREFRKQINRLDSKVVRTHPPAHTGASDTIQPPDAPLSDSDTVEGDLV